MANAPRPLVAGNWKMNGLQRSVTELKRIAHGVHAQAEKVDILVCPPATLIMSFAAAARGTAVAIGGQDCHAEPNGAFTRDISAEMLKDARASAVILGHSERRSLHNESDAGVRAKGLAPPRARLTALGCVGEAP